MKKILVVAESIDVDDSSGTKGRVALINNMIKIGYDVYVYHYTRKNIQIVGAKCVAIKEIKFSWNYFFSRFERRLRNKLKIDLHKIFEKIWGFSFTLLNDRDSIVRSLKRIDFQPDLVFTFSKGGSFRPHHAILKMPEYHDRWVAYIHDPYPMHLYPRPYAWVQPGYYKKWRFVWEMSQKAKYAAFPSFLLQDWMTSYFKYFQDKGIVIPHQIHTETSKDMKSNIDNKLRLKWNSGNFNILHAGSLLHARDPKALLKAFEKFLEGISPEERHKCNLFFVGSANNHLAVLKEFSHRNEEIKFIDKTLSFSVVYRMQQEAAVNVILEAKSEISPFLPGKFPHCISADKIIFSLSPYYSEVKRLLGEDYTYWSEVDNEDKIFELITLAYEKWLSGNNKLNRPDLLKYLSEDHLKKIVDQLN